MLITSATTNPREMISGVRTSLKNRTEMMQIKSKPCQRLLWRLLRVKSSSSVWFCDTSNEMVGYCFSSREMAWLTDFFKPSMLASDCLITEKTMERLPLKYE